MIQRAFRWLDRTSAHIAQATGRSECWQPAREPALGAAPQGPQASKLCRGPATSAQEALAARAGTAADWEELSESPEMAAYRAALAKDKQLCTDFRAKLDAN